MFTTNRFATVILLLLIALSFSTPATAQNLDKKPIIIAAERRSTGEVILRAIVVAAPCTGRYVVQNTLNGRSMDLSEMKVGEVRTFATGWFSRAGEFSISFQESESQPSTACPYWKSPQLDTIALTINNEGKLDGSRRLPGMYFNDMGKTTVRVVEQLQAPLELRLLFRFPSGNQTQLYVFQLFPNDTSSVIEDITAAPSPAAFGYSVIGFPLTRMTTALPIYFVAIRDGVSTSGVIFTP
jgi:hypothetical protein